MEARRVHRLDAHLRLEDAGVVDQRGQRAQLAIARLEQPHHVGFDRDVGLHGERAAAGLCDRLHDGVGRVAPFAGS